MASVFQRVSVHFFLVCNLVVSIALLLLYFQPYSNQDTWWWLNLFALGMPLLLLLQVGFIFFWLFAKRVYLLVPMVTLVLAWPLMRSFFAPNFFNNEKQQQHDFRIATWNVALLHFFQQNGRYDPKMIEQARSFNADVLLLQEFVFSEDKNAFSALEKIKRKLGYRYAVTASDASFGVRTMNNAGKGDFHPFCIALFSKHPIVQWEKVQSADRYNYTFLWADVKVKTDTIRIINVHLQSMYFVKRDYEFIENIHQKNLDEMKLGGGVILRKMRNAYLQRAEQAKRVAALVAESPYPVLLAGDFNDVPNSFTHQLLTKSLQDAFTQSGEGVGRTFMHLAPTLRIDHVLHSNAFIPIRSDVVKPALSDHLPVVADFSFQAK